MTTAHGETYPHFLIDCFCIIFIYFCERNFNTSSEYDGWIALTFMSPLCTSPLPLLGPRVILIKSLTAAKNAVDHTISMEAALLDFMLQDKRYLHSLFKKKKKGDDGGDRTCDHILETSHPTSPHLTPPHPTSPHLTPPHPTPPHLTISLSSLPLLQLMISVGLNLYL